MKLLRPFDRDHPSLKLRATDDEPSTEKVQSNRSVTVLFGSSDGDKPPSPIKSKKLSSAYSVRDGAIVVKVIVVPLYQWVPLRGVLTVKCLLLPLRKNPSLLPERLLTNLDYSSQ